MQVKTFQLLLYQRNFPLFSCDPLDKLNMFSKILQQVHVHLHHFSIFLHVFLFELQFFLKIHVQLVMHVFLVLDDRNLQHMENMSLLLVNNELNQKILQ